MNLPPILILAGGIGSRIAHISKNSPKCLIPINGVPFINLQLEQLQRNGFREVYISLGFKGDLVTRHILNNNFEKLDIRFILDGDTPLGTGGAVLNSLPKLGSEFLIIYGDSYLNIDYQSFYNWSNSFKASILIFKNTNQFDKSNVKKLTGQKIYYDKNTEDETYDYIDCGLLYFKKEVFEQHKMNPKFDLSDLLKLLSIKNELYGYETNTRFFEIGSEQGIADLSWYLNNDA